MDTFHCTTALVTDTAKCIHFHNKPNNNNDTILTRRCFGMDIHQEHTPQTFVLKYVINQVRSEPTHKLEKMKWFVLSQRGFLTICIIYILW